MTYASLLGMAIFSTFAAILIDGLTKHDLGEFVYFGCGTRKNSCKKLTQKTVL
jgi:hypothetical protein